MSTRGVFGVRYQGADKLMYNHSDSYPSWLGQHIVEQLEASIEKHAWDVQAAIASWRELAAKTRLINERTAPTEADKQLCIDAGLIEADVELQEGDEWYWMMRDAQGDLIRCLEVGIFLDGNEFINDSLSCEWGYILNLDNNPCLEVYRGRQKRRHDRGRYAQNAPENHGAGIGRYYPCALIAEIPIEEIPQIGKFEARLAKEAPAEFALA